MGCCPSMSCQPDSRIAAGKPLPQEEMLKKYLWERLSSLDLHDWINIQPSKLNSNSELSELVNNPSSPHISSRPGVTATADMGVLPSVLGCRTLRRTVQVRLRSNTLWHAHFHGLATVIHETSGLRLKVEVSTPSFRKARSDYPESSKTIRYWIPDLARHWRTRPVWRLFPPSNLSWHSAYHLFENFRFYPA